jgi:DHA2 family multidrug resistance protein-like MFS transporter
VIMNSGDAPRERWQKWAGLAVLALPTMLSSLDISVLFLAVPHLSTGLRASSIQQLWITDIYGFMTSAFLVSMGSLGDRIGRRKLLLIGATCFGCASVMAAFSVNGTMLIVARALMGIAGASLLPSILALIGNMFSNPRSRAFALAVWMTCFMGGIALGPVIGGILLESFWWGSVFLMGVPVMLILLITGPLLLPEYRAPRRGKFDLISVALSLLAIMPFIYGWKEVTRYGWSATYIVLVVLGVAFGVLFVLRQRRLADPLLDMRLFGIKAFSGALGVGLLVGGMQSGIAFLIAQYLQLIAKLSPEQAGLWLVVPAVFLIGGINLAPFAARRFRPGYVLATGMVISALGELLLIVAGDRGGLPVIIASVSIIYLGVGPAAALINVLVLASVPQDRMGAAEAASGTSGEFGVALGIAVFGSIAAAVYRSHLVIPHGVPGGAARTASQGIAGAASAGRQIPAVLGSELTTSARHAFVSGLTAVAYVSIVIFASLAVVAVTLLRDIRPIGAAEPGQADDVPGSLSESPGRA